MIEWRWLALLALTTVALPFLGAPMAACTIAHELGHAVAARRAGAKVRSIELRAGHGLCVHDRVDDPRAQLRIALAGPIAHALFAVSLAALLEGVRLAVASPSGLDTMLFLSARFTATLGPLHALASLVPGLFFEGDSALASDGHAARRAWSALRGRAERGGLDARAGLLVVERFDRPSAGRADGGAAVDAGEWAQRIAARVDGEVEVGRAWSGSGATVVRLRLRRGRAAGAACDVVVRDARVSWPAGVPLLSVRVSPWSTLDEPLIWLTSGALSAVASAAIVIALPSDGLELSLVAGLLAFALVFALAALVAERWHVGVDLRRSEEPMQALAEAVRRAMAEEP